MSNVSTYNKLFTQFAAIDDANQNLLRKTRGDKVIWLMVILLAILSVLVVYSATSYLIVNEGSVGQYLFKQLSLVVLGIFLIYFLHRVNYTFYSRFALIAYLISIPLLIYTIFFGKTINDSNRWIQLPLVNLTFQTGDFAKLVLFMYLSRQLSRSQNYIKDFKKGFLPLIIPIGVTCLLLWPEGMSSAALTLAISLLLLFIGRVRAKYLLGTLAIAAIPALIMIMLVMSAYDKNTNTVNKNVNPVVNAFCSIGRISTGIKRTGDFFWAKDENLPDQVKQAHMAIANGNVLWGKGPGNSTQKYFLNQGYNDFVYSIIIEEYGLLFATIILIVYLIFLFRCIRIFKRCPFAFGAFLAMGLGFTLVLQALANMAVNVHLVPVTGVTLPLISMGGTSFLFTCAAIGIILSVARNVEQIEGKAAIQNTSIDKEEEQAVSNK